MKRVIKFFSTILLVIIIALSVIGCGASYKVDEATEATQESMAYDMAAKEAPKMEMNKQAARDDGMNESNNLGSVPPQSIIGDRKIIFNAYMALEVDDFDETFNFIQYLVESTSSGYIQNSSVRSHKISSKSEDYIKEGTIVLRIAQNKYNSVIEEVKKLGTVTRSDNNTEEVTDQYYDAKYRTQMYETERDRIMQYLKDAKDLETMLILERKLSEVTYEIERLKGTLRHLDNLVDFSTITIELNEKTPGGISYDSFTYRLSQAFKRSLTGIVDAFGNLIIGLINIIPILVVLLVIYLIGKPIVRKLLEKRNTNKLE